MVIITTIKNGKHNLVLMKHTIPVTLVLVVLFLLSQIVGLFLIDKSIDKELTGVTGNVTFEALPYQIERPDIDTNTSFIFIIVAVFIGTILVLLLMKFRKPRIWKYWYLLSVVMTISISLSVLFSEIFAFIIGIVVGFFKTFKSNPYLHNVSEIFIYSGIALIFVPLMNVFSVTMLLIFISIYDMYAVWKSKHMVKLAQFQSQTNVFAGLSIPYSIGKNKLDVKIDTVPNELKKSSKSSVAVLGGGDMAFPLLFSGVVLKTYGIFSSYIITIFAAIALFLLLWKSQKGKFYPAMPFISAGCFVGFLIVFLI